MKNFLRSLTAIAAVAVLLSACKKPTANFTADKTEVAIGEVVTFTNSSEDATIYMWDFGDGTQTMQKNPTHVYNAPGDYQVTMTSAKKNNKKPADAAAVTIKVKAPNAPTAAFTSSKSAAMPGEVITFAATDTSADEFVWDFGDGAMSLSPNATHVYQMGGTYTVTLTVYGWDRKYSDTESMTITIGNGSGDFGVMSKLVGKWKISAHALTHTVGANTVQVCNSIQPQPYSYTFAASTTPMVEVLSDGRIFQYDLDNNVRNTSNYNVLDATRMNWFHQGLYSSGPFTPTINGTNLPTFIPMGATQSTVIWTITELSSTTLKLTATYKNSNGSVTNNCVNPPVTTTGLQTITETVTYTKL